VVSDERSPDWLARSTLRCTHVDTTLADDEGPRGYDLRIRPRAVATALDRLRALRSVLAEDRS
jgi:hypothetical protein